MAEIRAERVANVWKVTARPGDAVAEGDTLLVLETGKMEIPVQAGNPGRVVDVVVDEGDVVREGDLLAVVE
ncbi:biotin/lipoyl-binding carrier protein [Thermobifida cellulosilytica]|uniref:Acetyl-CoA carboxylase n=1 Tax=Thermobifida cellulosilytica TB100 TaxID=665004 RepID=A0A147KGX7_THECS|nr:biotin/lipoyl-binding carrier protein [Thermobifida cellulosilytica]KUP96556.1 acetyl-CoA carboxylase [Thermobifida cellulosilytica TB100]